MPIYVYKCQACGHKMDALQKMSAAPLTQCPVCEEDKLKKQMTSAAFRLKGTGWYETDFKNNGKSPEHGKSSEHGHSSHKEDSSKKTETKSAESAAGSTAAADNGKSGSSAVVEKSA